MNFAFIYIFKVFKFSYTHSQIEPWYTPAQIQSTAKVLNSIRYQDEFQQWFVPDYQHRQGCRNYLILCGRAAEYLIDNFADVWNCQSEVVKLPKGRKKFQVLFPPQNYKERYQAHVYCCLNTSYFNFIFIFDIENISTALLFTQF